MTYGYHRSILLLATLGFVTTVLLEGAQQPAPPAQKATGTISAGVTAVLVDTVVRDKKGLPVRDLQQADFEVLEDGVRQPIGSFTPIFENPIAPPPIAAAAPVVAAPVAEPPAASPAVTALVFDKLSAEGRQLAVHAAKSYLGDSKQTPTYIGVYGIDLALTPYAAFTRDPAVLRKALDGVESHASSSFGIDGERKANLEQAGAASQQTADAAAAGGGAGMGTSPGAAQLAQMESRMLDEFQVLEHDEQGYSTVNGLFAIINALKPLPGRKSLVFFSEGVAIPPAVQRLFLGVIDAANRANVSIYTMDAAGLRAESEQGKIRDEVNQAGKRGLTSYASSPGPVEAPLSKALEKNEDVLRQDAHTGLGDLASGTGGQLFENTNNLRNGFERIDSDLRNYYLIGYTPTNGTYDGTFRKIEIKVRRSGVVVAARKGYFAVRDTGGAPVNAWEAPALAAFDRRPVPNAFPFRAAAMLFPDNDRPGLLPVVVDLKTTAMSFPTSEDQKTFKSDFAIIVRFIGDKNRVVRKLSQHYEMAAATSDLTAAKNSEVIFYREPELPPGVYTMETMVFDNPSGKASVRYATVEVPKPDPGKLRMSSLVIVKRGEKVHDDEKKGGPLFVQDVLIYPNLGDDVSKTAKELGFFFTVYPGAVAAVPEAFLEVIQNGKPLAEVPLPLDTADASGRIQQVGRLPLDALPAGTYELRAIVKQGTEQVYRSAMIHVAD